MYAIRSYYAVAYVVMASLMSVGLVTAFLISEPVHEIRKADVMLEKRVVEFMNLQLKFRLLIQLELVIVLMLVIFMDL